MFQSDGTIRPRFLGIFNPATNLLDSSYIDGGSITGLDAGNITV